MRERERERKINVRQRELEKKGERERERERTVCLWFHCFFLKHMIDLFINRLPKDRYYEGTFINLDLTPLVIGNTLKGHAYDFSKCRQFHWLYEIASVILRLGQLLYVFDLFWDGGFQTCVYFQHFNGVWFIWFKPCCDVMIHVFASYIVWNFIKAAHMLTPFCPYKWIVYLIQKCDIHFKLIQVLFRNSNGLQVFFLALVSVVYFFMFLFTSSYEHK